MSESPDVLPDGRLRLDSEVALPEMLDVLVVGGGPAGTAAAFRAKELGLSALVIEMDDILKRIRDYDKAKPIKPDFGAGKQMGFPKGGALIERLHFFTDIGGGDLCAAWKALYRRYSVPAQTGIELIGMEAGGGGAWRALVRNHRTRRNDALRAKHVVLALGAGMPRRLDVPGDVRAISNRLTDAKSHVGAPACVIGGGVSAAEAVIAISEAKAAAGDDSPVYWSYRGRNMPTVPQALETSMSRANSVARNVRLLPGSEAQEIAEIDGRPLLRVRVDTAADGASAMAVDDSSAVPSPRGGSPELAGERFPSMEFQVSHVVVCIGQEIDWRLMNDIGIFPVAGGAQVRKAIPLNALLESRQPNVYVIGDTLNPSYLECDDFDGDLSEFRKITHRGNIKAALIDGVRVADVIAQRLVGKAEIHIDLEFVGADAAAPRSPAGAPPATFTRLLDGAVEAEQFVLHTDRITTVGRRGSDICFEDDVRLADRHAVIVPHGDGYRLRDEGSRAGVFLHLTDGRERVVAPGSVARLGRQWLVFGTRQNPRLLAHHDSRGRLVDRHQLSEGTQVIGRDAPDITLAADDSSLSRRHATVAVVGPDVFMRDLNSVNGTYLKVDGSCVLADGDVVRIGAQALRFQFVREEERFETRTIHRSSIGRPVSASVAADAARNTVTFSNRGAPCPFKPGQTLCEVAEGNGVELPADCHAGICGSDPVRVVSGGDHLNPMSGEERATLEDLCAVDPETHRLACMARPTGPVVVEIIDG